MIRAFSDTNERFLPRQSAKGGTLDQSLCYEGFFHRTGRTGNEHFLGVLQELRHQSTSMATLLETTAGTPSAWEQTQRG